MTPPIRFNLILLCALFWQVLPGQIALASPEEISIGYLSRVAGDLVKTEGGFQLKAVELAVKELNAAGGIKGKKIKLVIRESFGTNEGAFEAAVQLIEKDKVLALVGPAFSAQVNALKPLIEKAGIPTMVGGTLPNLVDQTHWIFRCRPSDKITAFAMAKYLKEETKFKKIAILHVSDAFGVGGSGLVRQAAESMGLSIVARETFENGQTEFSRQFESIQKAGAEAVVVYTGAAKTAGDLMKYWRTAGRPFFYMGSPSSGSKVALDNAKDAAEGVVSAFEVIQGSTPTNAKFLESYRREYQAEPDAIQQYAYDAMMLLAKAIREKGENRSDIRQALLATHGYPGIMGTYDFNPSGDGLNEITLAKIEKGQPNALKIIKVQN